ncbi:10828_t:CDS:2, partial [Funneliformis geosporum]
SLLLEMVNSQAKTFIPTVVESSQFLSKPLNPMPIIRETNRNISGHNVWWSTYGET